MTSQLTPSGMSLTIWHCYRDYLWIVGSTSWIGRIASGFRILSFLVIFPIVVLALLVRLSHLKRMNVYHWHVVPCSNERIFYGHVPTVFVI